ncbi:MAG: PepSY domain-containing protein [Thiobacillus sp.]
MRKKRPEEARPNGRNFVYLDPRSGAVQQVERGLSAPRGTRVFNTLYPLHVGAIAGTPTRGLQAGVGVAPPALPATGFVMWKKRSKRKSARPHPAAGAHPDPPRHPLRQPRPLTQTIRIIIITK